MKKDKDDLDKKIREIKEYMDICEEAINESLAMEKQNVESKFNLILQRREQKLLQSDLNNALEELKQVKVAIAQAKREFPVCYIKLNEEDRGYVDDLFNSRNGSRWNDNDVAKLKEKFNWTDDDCKAVWKSLTSQKHKKATTPIQKVVNIHTQKADAFEEEDPDEITVNRNQLFNPV